MTLLKAAAPCPCNDGAVDAGQPPFGGLVEPRQPTLGILAAVIVGGATGARLMGGLMGLVGSSEACPCSFRCRTPNEMGPSRSDRPIFQNTGNERKQGCKAPN